MSADDAEAAVRIVDDALEGMTGGIDQAIRKLRTQLERDLPRGRDALRGATGGTFQVRVISLTTKPKNNQEQC